MKKAAAVILAIALILGLLPLAYAERSGDFQYEILADNTIEITKYRSYTDVETMIIPELIDGYTVSSIGRGAFQYASISNLEIGENIKSIGESAFFSCTAKTVSIKSKDIKIGKKAFSCCTDINDFTLIANNVEIGDSAFMYAAPMKNVTWTLADEDAQGTRTIIGDNGFFSAGIVNITIPGDSLDIGKKAFSCCSSLKSMTALCKTISIADQAFMYASFDTFNMPNAGAVESACQMSSELYAVRQKKSSRHETYCILPQCV